MGERPKITPEKLLEYAFIWDEAKNEWVTAYRRDWRRQKTVTFVDEVTFNASVTTYTSDVYEVAPYANFLLLVNLDVTGTPTDIYINVQFSDDGATWYKYMRGPFGDLRWEDTAGDKMECIDGPILAKYMRLYLVASGTAANATFKMTVKAILNG